MRKRRRNRNISKHEKCVNKNVVGRARKEYYNDNQEGLLPEERNKEQTTLKSTKKRTGNIKKQNQKIRERQNAIKKTQKQQMRRIDADIRK